MTIAMRTGSTLQYLHTDHLGGVAAVTDSAGVYSTNQSYFAYGKKRAGGTLPTTINYTGQRLDGSGLVYMNARYYDPLVGMFISPDTIVPDAGVLIDYNRFAYARGNSLKYNDPSGHCIFGIDSFVCAVIAVLGGGAMGYTGGRVVYEAGTQQFPRAEQARRDQIGGSLVTNLAKTIATQGTAHSVNPTTIAAIIRHEGSAIERRSLTVSPSSSPGAAANLAEHLQSLIQGDQASIGIAQMQIRRAKELEDLGYVIPATSAYDRRNALLDPECAVGYVAGMLHYLSDQLQTINGFSDLSISDQNSLIAIGYNQGWEILQYNITALGFNGLIDSVIYDNQTLDEYARWSEGNQ